MKVGEETKVLVSLILSSSCAVLMRSFGERAILILMDRTIDYKRLSILCHFEKGLLSLNEVNPK